MPGKLTIPITIKRRSWWGRLGQFPKVLRADYRTFRAKVGPLLALVAAWRLAGSLIWVGRKRVM